MTIKSKFRTSIVIAVISFVAIALAAGPTLLRAMTVEATPIGGLAQQAFVGGAIVHGTSDAQKITCSTGSSENTNGLQFSAHTRLGTLHGYWDIASPFTGAENKGGYIYDGKTDGKTYELKGKETHDGICQAESNRRI